ncbi:MAG: DEAD/DEAH box helicase [Alphaproteobacteria bacterium]|nr:DEAD/DEAH box helicase [Alphaproteobacteria bacterium]
MQNFSDLGLGAPILRALETEGYTAPTPIQAQAIPEVLAGHDVLAIAQTGTGKTAAFTLPILERLAAAPARPGRGGCRVLVLSPTRELANQIVDSVRVYGRHLRPSTAVVVGGMPMGRQVREMSAGVDVLVATPGRLLDHMGGGTIRLDAVETLVLDEADQMLDLGFMPAIQRIVARLPEKRQVLLFSATMPPDIARLAERLMHDPVRIAANRAATPAPKIEQRVLLVETARKRAILSDILGDRGTVSRALVFTRTKHGADRVARQLDQDGIAAGVIHGNRSQPQRERALAAFRAGTAPVLVATDIAARGIDVDGVSHVVNFDLPNVPESYVHRIGRTGRAGATGIAISLCSAEERGFLRAIEALIRQDLPTEDRRSAGAMAQEREVEQAARGNGKGRRQPGRPQRAGQHRQEGHRHEGQRQEGRRQEGHRHEGQRQEGRRQEGHRHEGQRPEGRRNAAGKPQHGNGHANGHANGPRRGHDAPARGAAPRWHETEMARGEADPGADNRRHAHRGGHGARAHETDGARVLAQMGRTSFQHPGQRPAGPRGKNRQRNRQRHDGGGARAPRYA